MRIAYVSMDPGIPVFGGKGAAIHVQSMLRAFLELGAEVTLISPRTEGEPPQSLRGARPDGGLCPGMRVVPLALPRGSGGDGDRAGALLAANATLGAVLAAQGPFDLVYERHALYAHAAMAHAAVAGIPSILEINAPLIEEQARHRDLARPEAALEATRACLSAAGHVVAVSPAVASYARAHSAARVTVLANAIEAARPALPHVPGPFTVGFLGSLRPWHDIGVLLDAMEIVRRRIPAHLLIVGDGPDRARLAHRLQAIGAEVTGMVPHADLPRHLARLDVGVAPYSAGQPFYFSPLKLFDYMGAALPVVASRVGDMAAMLQEGRLGLLCPPDDPDALARALERLAADPALRTQLGVAGRAHVMAHHTWDRVARRVLALAGLEVPA